MFRDLKQNVNARMTAASNQINEMKSEMKVQLAEMNQRFDQVNRELADNHKRMAKVEGSFEGFLAGRRDRDAA